MAWPDVDGLMVMADRPPAYRRVYTELPAQHLWSYFRQFEVTAGVAEGFEVSDEIAEAVSDCVGQAREYYRAASTSPLLTRPVLIYYGMVSLVKLFFLLADEPLSMEQIEAIERTGHGLKQDDVDAQSGSKYFLERAIVTVGADRVKGGVQVPRGVFPHLARYVSPNDTSAWLGRSIATAELFRMIPQLHDLCVTTLEGRTGYRGLPAQIVMNGDNTIIQIRKHESLPNDAEGLYERVNYLSREHFKFEPTGNDRVPFQLQVGSAAIAHRLAEREELTGFNSAMAPAWNGARLDSILAQFMLMYGLSIVARYKPHRWSRIVEGRSTPLLPILERLMYVAERWWPNLVLNRLTRMVTTFAPPAYMSG